MVVKVKELVREVRIALDRNDTSDSFLTERDRDALSLDEIIESKIEEAARRVQNNAAIHYLEPGHNFGESIIRNEDGSGCVLLPDDFGRLIVFRMSDWKRAVYSAKSAEDMDYGLQTSRYVGIRGTTQKPVCVIRIRPEGRVLEYYSSKERDAYVAEGMYSPDPRIDKYGGIDISERCRRSIVYATAGLVSGAIGEAEKMKEFFELSGTAIG